MSTALGLHQGAMWVFILQKIDRIEKNVLKKGSGPHLRLRRLLCDLYNSTYHATHYRRICGIITENTFKTQVKFGLKDKIYSMLCDNERTLELLFLLLLPDSYCFPHIPPHR